MSDQTAAAAAPAAAAAAAAVFAALAARDFTVDRILLGFFSFARSWLSMPSKNGSVWSDGISIGTTPTLIVRGLVSASLKYVITSSPLISSTLPRPSFLLRTSWPILYFTWTPVLARRAARETPFATQSIPEWPEK